MKERKKTSKVVQFDLLKVELMRFKLSFGWFMHIKVLNKQAKREKIGFLMLLVLFYCFNMTHSIPIVQTNSNIDTTSTPRTITQISQSINESNSKNLNTSSHNRSTAFDIQQQTLESLAGFSLTSLTANRNGTLVYSNAELIKSIKNIMLLFDEDSDQQLSISEFKKMLTNSQIAKKFERILNKKPHIVMNSNSHLNIISNNDFNKNYANNPNNSNDATNSITSTENNLKDNNQIEHLNKISTSSIEAVLTTFAHQTSTVQSTTTSTSPQTSTTTPTNTLPNVDPFQPFSFLNQERSLNVQNPSNNNPNNNRRYENSRSNKRMRIHEEFMRKEKELFQSTNTPI